MRSFTHRTATGEIMLIAEMDNKHLENTIKLILKRYDQAAKAINQVTWLTLEMELLGIYADPEEIKEQLQQLLEILPPYIFEAMLRGIDLSKDIQAAIGRTEAMPKLSNSYRRRSQKPEWQVLPCPWNDDYEDFDPMDYGDR